MSNLRAHEFLHLQEHIRSEAAAAVSLRQMAQQCQDPQLKQFVETQAREAEQLVNHLSSFIKV